MTRTSRSPKKPRPAASRAQPATIFRDFLRQLERLDASRPRENGR